VEFPLSETGMNVNTKSGKQKVTPQEFMDVQKDFDADFFECLSIDVPYCILILCKKGNYKRYHNKAYKEIG
jgi:hypothetical protein